MHTRLKRRYVEIHSFNMGMQVQYVLVSKVGICKVYFKQGTSAIKLNESSKRYFSPRYELLTV